MKEIAKLDGAIIVHQDGTVEAAARFISVQADGITLSKGLGKHAFSASEIDKSSSAVRRGVADPRSQCAILRRPR